MISLNWASRWGTYSPILPLIWREGVGVGPREGTLTLPLKGEVVCSLD